jgi:hypothetical protein
MDENQLNELTEAEKLQLEQQLNFIAQQEQIAKLTIRVSLLEKFLVENKVIDGVDLKNKIDEGFKALSDVIVKLLNKKD